MGLVDLQIVGGGRMEALLTGLVAADPERRLRVVEPDVPRLEALRESFPTIEVSAEPGVAAGTVIAVKPQHVEAVAATLSALDCPRVLSIAAGVTIAALEAALKPGTAVIRAMPNTPALVGAGAAAIAAGHAAGDDDLAWAESVLGAVGLVVRVPESQLDAVTGLSGSGPAYVFLVLESMIDGGVAAGLPRDVAVALATQTVYGAALALEDGASAAELRAAVTSPGGTTAAGLRVLEQRATRSAVIDAVLAARDRAAELG